MPKKTKKAKKSGKPRKKNKLKDSLPKGSKPVTPVQDADSNSVQEEDNKSEIGFNKNDRSTRRSVKVWML